MKLCACGYKTASLSHSECCRCQRKRRDKESNILCACGAKATVIKTSQCKQCYQAAWRARNIAETGHSKRTRPVRRRCTRCDCWLRIGAMFKECAPCRKNCNPNAMVFSTVGRNDRMGRW